MIQGKPCSQRREFFILRPGGAKSLPQFRDPPQKPRWPAGKYFSTLVQQFSLFGALYLQPTASARAAKNFAEEFSIGRMNQSVGTQDLLQLWERFARGKKQPAAIQVVPLLLQAKLNSAEGSIGQALRFSSDSRNESASIFEAHFLRGVIGLSEFVAKCFH